MFAGKGVKLEKVGPTFSSFQFISIVAIRTGDDVEKFQFLNIVLKKEIGPLFLEASCCEVIKR